MNPLLERFSTEKKKEQLGFSRLRKQFESKVTRWVYWDWPKWYWEPDRYLLLGAKSKPVQKEKARFGLGHDQAGNIVVIHRFSLQGKLEAMDFMRYSKGKIIGSHYIAGAICKDGRVVDNDFQAGGVLAEVFEALVQGGHIVRLECLMETWWQWKSFSWVDNRVATVLEGLRGRKPHRRKTYDKSGEVIEDLDMTRPPKIKPLPKGVTLKSLAKQILQHLVADVVARVTKAKVKEPVYCLVLNYDCEGNPKLPPELGIGLESERQARLKQGGKDAKLDIWDAETFSLFANKKTMLDAKELMAACDLFNREMERQGSDEPARQLILDATRALAKLNWSGKLNTTDDFIVYAVDTDGVDLRKNLKASVSPKLLAKLRAAKLI